MKTSILVTGSGISSKSTLVMSISTMDSENIKMNFGNTEIRFRTKKEAVEAMHNAYEQLKSDEEDWNASCAGYRKGDVLIYDASNARIIKTN